MCTKSTIRLFGKFRVQREDGAQITIESKKAMELFGYLLVYRDRPHTRESLAASNWGDSPAARSKKYLRQALWQIQSALDSQEAAESTPLLITEPHWVQLNPAAPLWLDIAEFEEAYTSTQRKSYAELSNEEFHCLDQAAGYYQGDLLEGWYEDWCLYERERFQNMCLAMLDKLMGYCELHDQYQDALAYGEEILRMDVAHERTHRRMVRIYYKSGERTAALRQYERCVSALMEELGVSPSRKTLELYERIRDDNPAHHLRPREASSSPMSRSMALRRLSHLKNLLQSFSDQVLEEISLLEQALNEKDLENPPQSG
jgi:DNA-binding SARP family transcriptional activator